MKLLTSSLSLSLSFFLPLFVSPLSHSLSPLAFSFLLSLRQSTLPWYWVTCWRTVLPRQPVHPSPSNPITHGDREKKDELTDWTDLNLPSSPRAWQTHSPVNTMWLFKVRVIARQSVNKMPIEERWIDCHEVQAIHHTITIQDKNCNLLGLFTNRLPSGARSLWIRAKWDNLTMGWRLCETGWETDHDGRREQMRGVVVWGGYESGQAYTVS